MLLQYKEISHDQTRLEYLKFVFSDFGIFEFKREGEGKKIAKFRNIQIFEHNLSLNYSKIKKFHSKRVNLNTKKQMSAILDISILRGSREGGGITKLLCIVRKIIIIYFFLSFIVKVRFAQVILFICK